jgi:hypothetical protein
MVVLIFFALTVSIRWRLLFPTICWSINTKPTVKLLQLISILQILLRIFDSYGWLSCHMARTFIQFYVKVYPYIVRNITCTILMTKKDTILFEWTSNPYPYLLLPTPIPLSGVGTTCFSSCCDKYSLKLERVLTTANAAGTNGLTCLYLENIKEKLLMRTYFYRHNCTVTRSKLKNKV